MSKISIKEYTAYRQDERGKGMSEQDESGMLNQNDDGISAQVTAIIESRKKYADQMKNQALEMRQERQRTQELENSINTIQSYSNNDKSLLYGPKAIEALNELSENVAKCLAAQKEAEMQYAKLAERFGRNTVNIGIIGMQGSGKSLFLSRASGVDDHVENDRVDERLIPYRDGRSYTGVTSVIENAPEIKEPEVYFTIKKKEFVLKDINRDIDSLWRLIRSDMPDPGTAPQVTSLENLEAQLRKIDNEISDEKRKRSNRFDSLKKEPAFVKNKENVWLQTDRLIRDQYDYFAKVYRDGNRTWSRLVYDTAADFDKWKERVEKECPLTFVEMETVYVGTESLSGLLEISLPKFRLTNTKQAQDFITKYKNKSKLSQGALDVYDYNCYHVAIHSALIRAPFTTTNAKIRLIDTVGIGDQAADTKERMNHAINTQCDSLIFLHSNDATNRVGASDFSDIDELSDIFKEHAEKNERIGSWTSFLVNVRKDGDKFTDEVIASVWLGDNGVESSLPDLMKEHGEKSDIMNSATAYYEKMQELYHYCQSHRLFGSPNDYMTVVMKKIVNVYDKDQVKQALDEVLRTLKGISVIDRSMMNNAKKAYDDARESQNTLWVALSQLDLNSQPNDRIRNEVDARRERFLASLESCYESGFQIIEAPINRLKKEIESMSRNEKTSVGKLSDIVAVAREKNKIKRFEDARTYALENTYLAVRRMIGMSRDHYKESERKLKEELAERFINDFGIDMTVISEEEGFTAKDPRFWGKMSSYLFGNHQNMDEMAEYFGFIDNLSLSACTTVSKLIVQQIAMKYLCLDSKKDDDTSFRLPDNEYQENFEKAMTNELSLRLEAIFNELDQSFTSEGNSWFGIALNELMKDELVSFQQCFALRYRAEWKDVFQDLSEKKVAMREEFEHYETIKKALASANATIREYKQTSQA